MGASLWLILGSVALILGNAFFVAVEYAIVTSRRSRMEAIAKKGNRTAQQALRAMEDPSRFIAVGQFAISMLGIGIGSFTEPFVTGQLRRLFGQVVPPAVSYIISVVFVTFLLVVVGELTPKYLVLRFAERTLLLTYRVVNFIAWVLTPVVWLSRATTALIVRPFGINLSESGGEAIQKDELLFLIQSGGREGVIEKTHAELVTRALKLDVLMAHDIMVHRLDIKWLDVGLTKDQLLQKLKSIPYTRLPVCRGDIDDMVGVVYLHDIVKNITDPKFSLEKILRETVAIPENLTMEKIVATMRDAKTQILIVMDEYGGTSGLITLEDVVEEVFGELEDRLESERPQIEPFPSGRVSARADVRLDELLSRLNISLDLDDPTATLAQVIVDNLGRVPRPGDSVTTPLGVFRVENMARRRITRVSIQLAEEFAQPSES